MTLLPIAERELRQAARRRRTYWIRFGVGLVAAVMTLSILSPSFSGLRPTTDTGRDLFLILSTLAMSYALVAGLFVTADSLSEEKRDGTLGLLFLTNLNGYDVVLGKLVAKSLNSFYGLLTIFPVLALTLLLGGVTAGEFYRMTLVLVNTLFLSLATGMMVSAYRRDGRKAMLDALALIFLMTAGPAAVFLIWPLTLATVVKSPCFLLSPGFAFYLSFDAPHGVSARQFLLSVVLTHLLAWTFLGAASWIISRSWRDIPVNVAISRWRVGRLNRPPLRLENRHQWLEQNPMLWLAKREGHQFAVLWGFVGFTVGVWFIGCLVFPKFVQRPEVVVLTTFVLHSVLKGWITWEVTRRLADDRRSGELELLLVTPLSVRDIVQGRMAAVKRQFLIPILLVVAVDVLFLFYGSKSTGWWGDEMTLALGYLVGIGLFVADTYTLCWVGLWQGLRARNSARAFSQTLSLVLVMPWLLFVILTAVLSALLTATMLSSGWLIAGFFTIGYFSDLTLCGWSMDRCYEKFRVAAAHGGSGLL